MPVGKETAKTLLALLRSGEARHPTPWSKSPADTAREFLSLVARLAKRRRLLIVADDIQYFDVRTLELLRGLLEAKSDTTDPDRIRYHQVLNTDAPSRDDIASIVGSLTATSNAIELRHCTKEQFGRVLIALGLNRGVPHSLSDLLYDCSGGHLHIANFIVDELNTISIPDIPPAAYSRPLSLHHLYVRYGGFPYVCITARFNQLRTLAERFHAKSSRV